MTTSWPAPTQWEEAFVKQALADLESACELEGNPASVALFLLHNCLEKLAKAAFYAEGKQHPQVRAMGHRAMTEMLRLMTTMPRSRRNLYPIIKRLTQCHPSEIPSGSKDRTPQLNYPWAVNEEVLTPEGNIHNAVGLHIPLAKDPNYVNLIHYARWLSKNYK